MNATALRKRCIVGHFLPAGTRTCRCGKPSTTAAADSRPRLSLVKPIPPLARRRPFTPVPLCEAAAARAAMAARATHLQVPVLAWHGHPDGTATAALADSTHLHYRDGAPVRFTAVVPCYLGAGHVHQITGPAGLDAARRAAAACTEPHADLSGWATAAARDLTAAFASRHTHTTTRVISLAQAKQEVRHGG